MITASEVQAMMLRRRTAGTAALAAKAARIAGENIDIEGWLIKQAANQPDAASQALLLAQGGKELADAGRTPGALELIRSAIIRARNADRDIMLQVLENATTVLEIAGMRDELAGIVNVLKDFRSWCTQRANTTATSNPGADATANKH